MLEEKEIEDDSEKKGKRKRWICFSLAALLCTLSFCVVFMAASHMFEPKPPKSSDVVVQSAAKKDSSASQKEAETEKKITEEKNKEKETEQEKASEKKKLAAESGEQVRIVVYGRDRRKAEADMVVLVSFDTGKKQLSFLSVPENLEVAMSQQMCSSLISRNLFLPKKRSCLLKEVPNLAGGGYEGNFMKQQTELITGYPINYYMEIRLEAFRRLVDAVGGIEMNLPEDYYYYDPTPKEEIYINLKAGRQTLTGAKAEMLVRYTGYEDKALGRIDTQQAFLRACLKKVLTTEGLFENLPNLCYQGIKSVRTDMSVSEALNLLRYAGEIQTEEVLFETLPVHAGNAADTYTYQPTEAKETADRIFQGRQEK